MAWAFRARIPRNAIRAVEQPAKVPLRFGIGVHGRNGTWAANGSGKDGVKLTLEPTKARVLFVPVTLKTLVLSLEEPAAFATAVDS